MGANWSSLFEPRLAEEASALGRNTYRITSIYDGSVLDVRGNGTESGTEVITYKYHGGKNQRWKARLHEGGIILTCENQGINSSVLQTLEQRVEGGAAQMNVYANTLNQKWYLEEIEPCGKKVLIRSLANDACLQNNSHGCQVSTADVATNEITPLHIWKIERL